MPASYSFISGDAKDEHFKSAARFDVSKHPHQTTFRVWPGQILAVLSTAGQRPMILGRFRVTGLTIDDWGLQVHMFEMTTGKILKVGNVPIRIPNTDIALRLQASTFVERTVRTLPDNKNPNYSVATIMTAMNKEASSNRRHHIKPWFETLPDFFDSAEERAEAALFYMENAFKFQEGL